jgi:hypothetical protein
MNRSALLLGFGLYGLVRMWRSWSSRHASAKSFEIQPEHLRDLLNAIPSGIGSKAFWPSISEPIDVGQLLNVSMLEARRGIHADANDSRFRIENAEASETRRLRLSGDSRPRKVPGSGDRRHR